MVQLVVSITILFILPTILNQKLLYIPFEQLVIVKFFNIIN